MLRTLRLSVAALAGLTLFAGTALAQDAVVEQARAAGQVGEQADGYLGIASGGSADLKARVDQINIKRRALYTQSASERGVTVDAMAAATACELFKSRVGPNQAYRDETGAWRKRDGAAPVKLPSFCGS
ncbi:MAG: DUF1318 domain-containing protein [Alphaproteobacteria bacterium]|nr:DUF1318 domain-containing protein [Alphaproteobacteria bacterium]